MHGCSLARNNIKHEIVVFGDPFHRNRNRVLRNLSATFLYALKSVMASHYYKKNEVKQSMNGLENDGLLER